jgi:hypothetical protein
MDTHTDDIDNKSYGINNRRGKKLKVKTKRRYANHKSPAIRGCYRTYVRSSVIDENYITPSLEINTYNWWYCKPYKPNVY